MLQAENIIEWLSVLLCSFANPVHSLSDVAALWTTTKKKCVIDLLSLLTGVAISRYIHILTTFPGICTCIYVYLIEYIKTEKTF